MQKEYLKGDYVYFTDITKVEYPARFVSKYTEDGITKVTVIACASKRKNSANDTYELAGNINQIRPMIISMR